MNLLRCSISTQSQTSSGNAANGGAIAFTAGENIAINVPITSTSSAVDGTIGTGGEIFLAAQGNLTTNAITSSVANINLTSANGAIGTTGLVSSGGGDITFRSTNGTISTGSIVASSSRGSAGAITLNALGNITTSVLAANSNAGNGNTITLISNTGSIRIESLRGFGFVSTWGNNPGDIIFRAAGNITTGTDFTDLARFNLFSNPAFPDLEPEPDFVFALDSRSLRGGRSGEIRLTSNNGSINTSSGTLYGGSVDGTGGAIALSANRTITVGDITTGGGNLRLSLNGDLTLSDATISTGGGDFILRRPRSLQLLGSGAIATNGGNITLQGRDIDVSRQITLDSGNVNGTGGSIALTATEAAVRVGNLNSSGSSGGNVSVSAETAIATGTINSSGSIGRGGNVTLDPSGDIQVRSINAQGGVRDGFVAQIG